MKVPLGEIAKIQFGLYAQPAEAGNAAYLQVKHFDERNRLITPLDTFINIGNKNKAHLLQDGDILLAGKGFRIFAWTYRAPVGQAVASSIFFVIKPDLTKVIPEFLTLIFNSPQTLAYFQNLGAGSSIPSIRKSELQVLTLDIPSFEIQQAVIKLKNLHEQDLYVSQQLIKEKQKLFQEITHKLIHQDEA